MVVKVTYSILQMLRLIPSFMLRNFAVCFDVSLGKLLKKSRVGDWRCNISYSNYAVVEYIYVGCNSPHHVRHVNLAWWRHQLETFSVLLAICTGNLPVTSEFPAQRPVTRSFGVFFDLRLNKRLSKQLLVWWFDTPSRPLWRHFWDCSWQLVSRGKMGWGHFILIAQIIYSHASAASTWDMV